MRMSEGVEWALHSCLNLAWVGSEHRVTAAKLAEFYELPTAYLNKQLQALARAGIVVSTSGPRGGFQLARDLDAITLLDVVVAIEGPDPAFRCTEIRRSGPGSDSSDDYTDSCVIAHAMGTAELAWRRELARQTLADIRSDVERRAPAVRDRTRRLLCA